MVNELRQATPRSVELIVPPGVLKSRKNRQNRVFTPSAWIDGYLDVTVSTGVPEVFTLFL